MKNSKIISTLLLFLSNVISIRFGIEIEGFSADGDARLLKCMRHNTNFAEQFDAVNDFLPNSAIAHKACCMQDTEHLGTKDRNRILKPSILLPMGTKAVSSSHLKMLIDTVPKSVHGLTIKDICPSDRQNFRSLEKVMQQKVYEALQKHIIDSEGTIMYFKICENMISSVIDDHLLPLERIQRIWHATFFMRAWRIWLSTSSAVASDYKLKDNFISDNAYACLEINAHNLIRIVRKFRDENKSDLFIPSLFSSQPCEEVFRQMRSMGTINFTKINFTLLELFHLVGRVELMNEIVYSKLADTSVSFPRNKISNVNVKRHNLPSDSEIQYAILTARKCAIEDASTFGMNIDESDLLNCNLNKVNITVTESTTFNNSTQSDHTYASTNNDETELPECSHYKDYSAINSNSKSNSFIDITSPDGKQKTIRKSTLVWALSTPKKSLSNDRLKRVQGIDAKKPCRRQLQFDSIVLSHESPVLKNPYLKIGDWCIFYSNIANSSLVGKPKFSFGNVLAFRYITGATEKARQYSWDFVPVSPDPTCTDKRGIEVLALWYEIHSDGKLVEIPGRNISFLNIESYISTLVSPSFDPKRGSNEHIRFTEAYLNEILPNLMTCFHN